MKSLVEDIRTNQFKNIYLLYGEEEYLKKQYRKKLADALVPPDDTVNVSYYEGKNISIKELIDQAETMPFFAERRLLIVEDSGFFKAANPQLADYLEEVPETTYLIFVESEVDKRQKLYKTVKNKSRIVEFAPQTEETLMRWVLGILKRENKNITRASIELFFEKTGTDMNQISSELEKLLSYTIGKDVITEEDIETICTTQLVNRIFEMIRAVTEGEQKKALDLYNDLLALKEPPMRILFLLTRQFHLLMQTKELQAGGYDAKTIASRLGVQPFIIRNCTRQCAAFSSEELLRLVELCVELEEAVKTGNLSDKLAVELVLSKAGNRKNP